MSTVRREATSQHPSAGSSFDALPLATIVLDGELRAIEVNRGWEQLSGRTAQDSRGTLWWRSIDPRDRDSLCAALSSTVLSDDLQVEHRLTVADGIRWTRWWWQHDGERISACAADVDAERARAQDLRRRASHDPLTGLANRTEFMMRLERAIDRAMSHPSLAVVYVDVDHFKSVNDSAGHRAGDAVLVAVAHAIVEAVRPFDVAARLGGDEFAVLCPGLGSEDEALALGARIASAVAASEATTGIPITASVGVAMSHERDGGADTIVARADRAMYREKAARSGEGAERGDLPQVHPSDVDELPSVLVPMLFRVGLSLHAVADSVDSASASQLRDLVDELDDLISSLRRSALARVRRAMDGPSVRTAFRDLEEALAGAERAVRRDWEEGVTHNANGADASLRLVRASRLLRAAEQALAPDVLG